MSETLDEAKQKIFEELVTKHRDDLLTATPKKTKIGGKAFGVAWKIGGSKMTPYLPDIIDQAIEHVKSTENESFLSTENKINMADPQQQAYAFPDKQIKIPALDDQQRRKYALTSLFSRLQNRGGVYDQEHDEYIVPLPSEKAHGVYAPVSGIDGEQLQRAKERAARLARADVDQVKFSRTYRDFHPNSLKNQTITKYKRDQHTGKLRPVGKVPVTITPEMTNLVNIVASNKMPKFYDQTLTEETAKKWLAKNRPGWQYLEADLTGPGGKEDGINESIVTDANGNIKIVNGYGLGLSDYDMQRFYWENNPEEEMPLQAFKRKINAIDVTGDDLNNPQFVSDFGKKYRSGGITARRYFAEFFFKPAYNYYNDMSDFNPENPFIGRLKLQAYNEILTGVLYGFVAKFHVEIKNPEWDFFGLDKKGQEKWKKQNKHALAQALVDIANNDRVAMIEIFQRILIELTTFWSDMYNESGMMGRDEIPFNAETIQNWNEVFDQVYSKVFLLKAAEKDEDEYKAYMALHDPSLQARIKHLEAIKGSKRQHSYLSAKLAAQQAQAEERRKRKEARETIKSQLGLKPEYIPKGYTGFFYKGQAPARGGGGGGSAPGSQPVVDEQLVAQLQAEAQKKNSHQPPK